MKKDRTSIEMVVTFTYPGDEEKYTEFVDIPFPIVIEALRKYFDNNLVTLDGTDNAIWNTFVDLHLFDNIEYNDDFIDICKKLYAGSSFEEEDYEEWKDGYEFDHNLGEYKDQD